LVVELVCLVIVFRLSHFLVAHTPCGVYVFPKPLHALLLGFFGHVHEKLDDDVTVVDEHALEVMSDALIASDDISMELATCNFCPILAHATFFRQLCNSLLPRAFEKFEQSLLDSGCIPATVVERNGPTLSKRLPKLLHHGEVILDTPLTSRKRTHGVNIKFSSDVHARCARIELIHEV